jgi:hypothetical protein
VEHFCPTATDRLWKWDKNESSHLKDRVCMKWCMVSAEAEAGTHKAPVAFARANDSSYSIAT